MTGSLTDVLMQRAREHPDRVALREKQLGRWGEITWAEYAARAAAVGAGLRALGVTDSRGVAINSENRPEWLLADLGALGIGAASVGIDPASAAAEVKGVLRDSKTVVAIVEDEEQLDKTLAVRKGLRSLKHIVLIDTRGVRDLDDPMVMTFADLEELGRSQPVATSGGASNDALTKASDDEVLSFLPLSVSAERDVSLVDAVRAGYVVNFGEPGAPIAETLREIQPTVLLGTPRVWEEMMATVETRMANASRLKRAVYRFAMARRGTNRVTAGVLWLIVLRSLRDKLGLSRVRSARSAGAPVPAEVTAFFAALGVSLDEVGA